MPQANISLTSNSCQYRCLHCKQYRAPKKELAVELTIETTSVCDNIKGRGVFTNQLLRACSSIGANYYDARYAQSDADFVHKLEIALKECYETDYWLEILYKVDAIQESAYKTLSNKCGAIRRKLIASIKSVKEKNEDV